MYALSTRSVHFIHENLSVIKIERFPDFETLWYFNVKTRSTKEQRRIDVKNRRLLDVSF